MRAIFLLEVIASIAFLWGFTTQIVIPFLDGEKFFPFFRNRRKLEGDLAEAKTKVADQKIKQQISEIRKGNV